MHIDVKLEIGPKRSFLGFVLRFAICFRFWFPLVFFFLILGMFVSGQG